MIKNLFSRKWFFTSLLVLAAMAVLARLGIWQLDRLAARRTFNNRVVEQQSASELILDAKSLSQNLNNMEYRKVNASGIYLPADEIILRNQVFEGRVGYQLFTPLLIEGSNTAVLVQRGWIPEDLALPSERSIFANDELLNVRGIIRRAQTDFGIILIPDPTLTADGVRLDAWNNLNLSRLSEQMETPILEIYIQILDHDENTDPPFPVNLSIDLSEGSHLGYAGQWFIFAILLGLGYPIYVKNQHGNARVE